MIPKSILPSDPQCTDTHARYHPGASRFLNVIWSVRGEAAMMMPI
jgi:hypothetical protein